MYSRPLPPALRFSGWRGGSFWLFSLSRTALVRAVRARAWGAVGAAMGSWELALLTAGVFLLAALVVTLLAYVGLVLIERWRGRRGR